MSKFFIVLVCLVSSNLAFAANTQFAKDAVVNKWLAQEFNRSRLKNETYKKINTILGEKDQAFFKRTFEKWNTQKSLFHFEAVLSYTYITYKGSPLMSLRVVKEEPLTILVNETDLLKIDPAAVHTSISLFLQSLKGDKNKNAILGLFFDEALAEEAGSKLIGIDDTFLLYVVGHLSSHYQNMQTLETELTDIEESEEREDLKLKAATTDDPLSSISLSRILAEYKLKHKTDNLISCEENSLSGQISFEVPNAIARFKFESKANSLYLTGKDGKKYLVKLAEVTVNKNDPNKISDRALTVSTYLCDNDDCALSDKLLTGDLGLNYMKKDYSHEKDTIQEFLIYKVLALKAISLCCKDSSCRGEIYKQTNYNNSPVRLVPGYDSQKVH